MFDGSSEVRVIICLLVWPRRSPRATRARLLGQPVEAFIEKAFSPAADYLAPCVETSGDLVILEPLGCQQYHLRPDDLVIR